MNFTKMEGLGNDYIYVNCINEELKFPEKVARYVSDRHFGIGSDGLILIKSSKIADFKMEIYNADGSRGKMCGNGIRCVAKYVYENKLTDKKCLTIETDSGNKFVTFETEYGEVSNVSVNMGNPSLLVKDIPVLYQKSMMINELVHILGTDYYVTAVSIGNPHAVIFVNDFFDLDIETIGKNLQNRTDLFPEGVNVEFVKVVDKNVLEVLVWERGSGETLACGTGACAAVVASVVNGNSEAWSLVKLKGGILQVNWDMPNNLIYIKGATNKVFEGIIDVESKPKILNIK